MRSSRIESLECLRGCAALTVVAWHLLIGFTPLISGLFANSVPHPIIGRIWFAPLNGAAAVTFFFVLSGFVLPYQYFRTGDAALIGHGILKRYPRLMGCCVMAVLISWLCFASGAYHFTQAAAISGSPWLMDFGFSGLGNNHHPSFWNALSEGSFLTFYNGEYHFDSSLWTMRPEIIGSVICLGVAPALRWTQGIIVPFCLIAIISTMLIGAEQHIPQFLAGTLLSRVLHERTYRLSSAIAIPLIAVAFILFSYDGPVGSFAWMRASGLTDWRTFPILWTPAAVILIYVTMGTPWIGRWLSGRIARLLGRLSFPIYLIHLPVLCSMGAWTYSELSPMLRWQIAVALTWIVTFLGTFLCALPLSLFDRWWVGRVNIFTRAFAPERSSGGSAGNRNNETSA